MMSNMRKELVLRTMTLRGIGPYLHGTRLDIKPLTILCGENGSGKSTWFKALNLLKQSQDRNAFPFTFTPDSEGSGYSYHDYTNAYLKTFSESADHPLDSSADIQFGPLGAIGLHFEAVEDHSLGHDDLTKEPPFADISTNPQAFLWQGLCQKGTQFRLRLAHPTPQGEGTPSLRLYNLVELCINDAYVIRFRKRLREKLYAFECSRAFLPGKDEDDYGTVRFADVEVEGGEEKVYSVDGSAAFDLLEPVCRNAILRVRQLLRELLAGFFYIGAIRQIETRDEEATTEKDKTDKDKADKDKVEKEAAIRQRYVGPQGMWTWHLENCFAFNLIRMPPDHRGTEPASQDFEENQILSWYGIWESMNGAAAQSPVKRILEIASPAVWGEVTEAVERYNVAKAEENALGNSADVDAARTRTSQEVRKIVGAVGALFNNVLGHRNLYRKEVWTDLEGEARFLVQRGPENLTETEVRLLNRRLIQAAFNRPGWHISRIPRFYLEMYVSFWLKKLVQTRIVLPDATMKEYPSLGDYWTNTSAPPVGFLASQTPELGPRPEFNADEEDIPKLNSTKFKRFLHVCFDGGSPTPVSPRYLSSGFHQIAPIVVQGALLRQNEIMAVENPEVHLHPSLQLHITEYLIQEAKASKLIVIETHSDLVVRRVLRAILKEEIRQAHVAVYFASLKGDESHGYHYASLERIQINDRGQVNNWPTGFMDDDLRESRQLMEAMYGTTPENEEPDDEEAVE